MWVGAIVDIPAGWVLCDGNNGTPNLQNKFVIGAGDAYAVDDAGGAATHTHSFTGDGHTHELVGSGDVNAGGTFSDVTGSAVANGTTDAGSSLPPYHALAYIMKT